MPLTGTLSPEDDMTHSELQASPQAVMTAPADKQLNARGGVRCPQQRRLGPPRVFTDYARRRRAKPTPRSLSVIRTQTRMRRLTSWSLSRHMWVTLQLCGSCLPQICASPVLGTIENWHITWLPRRRLETMAVAICDGVVTCCDVGKAARVQWKFVDFLVLSIVWCLWPRRVA
jgi:hypothetical protein